MKDLRIVSAKVQLKVTSVSPIRGFIPQSFVVVGENLNQADEVRYNGVQADEFVAQTPSRLIVRVPKSQVGKPFSDLRVLASASVTKKDAVLSLSMGLIKTISGIDRLVQSWVLIFMSTPGSDIFSPNSGGGGLSLVGRSTSKVGKNVVADLAMGIENTKQEILRYQAQNRSIPQNERLMSSSLDVVEFDEETTVLSARVNIQNMLGDVAEVSLR